MFVRISETKTKYGKTYKYLKLVSGGSRDARRVTRALKIKDFEP